MSNTQQLAITMTPERFRQLFLALAADEAYAVLLDSAGQDSETAGLYVMGLGAKRVLRFASGELFYDAPDAESSLCSSGKALQTPDDFWQAVAEAFDSAAQNALTPMTATGTGTHVFQRGWLGAMAYELRHWIEPTGMPCPDETPLGLCCFIEPALVMTYQSQTGAVFLSMPASETASMALTEGDVLRQQRVACYLTGDLAGDDDGVDAACALKTLRPRQWETATTPGVFSAQVETVLAHIAAGELYQANLSLRYSAPAALSWDEIACLYPALIAANPSPFSGLMKTPFGSIISNSPERLLAYDPVQNILDTRPIAGTRGRGSTPEADALLAEALAHNLKEQAEHVMLVDLMRNDLGRVAIPASVAVAQLGVIERYSHVMHLVSQVVAQKAPSSSVWDVLRAVFPGGTITGCPKIRCMQLLQDIETLPRGFYTGSLGYIDFSGAMDWNILIRSLYNWPTLDRLDSHAGAGLVADSVDSWEYKECQRKLAAIWQVLAQLSPVSPAAVTSQ